MLYTDMIKHNSLVFHNDNPITQNYLIGFCKEIASEKEKGNDPHVPNHLFSTLIAFNIMFRPTDDEVKTIFAEMEKKYKIKDEAVKAAKKYFVIKFCADNF